MTEIEKLADELARVTGEGSDDEALACLVRNLPTILAALRQHATALEIGRGMGREECAAMMADITGEGVQKSAPGHCARGWKIAGWKACPHCGADDNQNCPGDIFDGEKVATAIRTPSPALDVEALVERVFKTIVASEVVDEINPAYVDQFWEDRNGVHSGDCTKQAHTCLRCRAEAHEQLARAVIASLGVGE